MHLDFQNEATKDNRNWVLPGHLAKTSSEFNEIISFKIPCGMIGLESDSDKDRHIERDRTETEKQRKRHNGIEDPETEIVRHIETETQRDIKVTG